jgi:hypothetical protein
MGINARHILGVVTTLVLASMAFSSVSFARELQPGDDRGAITEAGDLAPADLLVGGGVDDSHPELGLVGRHGGDRRPELQWVARGSDDTHSEPIG